MKTREFKDKNYKAVYVKGKTMRFLCDNSKPMLELDYPEFYDVKITNKCNGKCPYCYQDSIESANQDSDMIEKIRNFFGPMTQNQRPFQVAIGGGEPTLHPQFIEILKTFNDFGITPNFTTNGMHITPEIIAATRFYCGGVAITCHEHLKKYWEAAFNNFSHNGVMTNFHIVISNKHSVDTFLEIYKKYKGKVDYFVLLPYINKGRAKPSKVEYKYLFDHIKKLGNIDDIAFGAKFYSKLSQLKKLDVSTYEPEIMSKYLDMVEMKMYKSSFEDKPIKSIA